MLISFVAKFCLLEQYLPNGPNHPFASTMLKHFNKLSSPLRVVQKYQSIESQQDRFYNHGWTNVQAQSLWAVWCEGQVFSPEERTTLRSVEIFDEHEEFALFASHYFILTATSLGPRKDIQNPPSSIKHSFSLDKKPHTLSRLPARRDGVLYEAQNNVFMYYGGDDCRTRMTTSQIYINNDGVDAKYDLEQLEISARKHHTITRLHAGYDYLLVGGRDSPERPLRDCWLLKDSSWSRVEDLPIPLFRHSATLVEIKTERDQCASGVIVVGGKTRHDRDSNAWFLWRESQGWKELKVESEEIVPIFSANCLYLSEQQTGILIGGMLSSEVVNDKIYAWTLSGEEICINPIQNTAYREDGFEVCRLGANLVQYKDSVFLVGGLTRNGLPWMTNHLTGAILEFKLHSDVYDPENVSLKCCTNRNTFRWPLEHEEPFLIGHSTIVKDNLLSIVGGGAVCFSFGSFMNSTSWHLDIGNDNAENWKTGIWKIYRPKDTPDLEVFHVNGDALNQDAHHLESERSLTSRGYISVNRLNSTTKETLSKRILKGKPCIFESVNLGCCIEKWTPEYLKQALDPERLLDIHYATADTMLFESKNFEIQKQKFPDFIDAVGVGQRRYLRAVSFKDKHKPANFYKDFEALASDFRIPIHLSITEKMQHSSVFRISGPVNMWLHYDTLSNILCQIRGSKRLILFSPADVAHLKIPAGRSSSDLNVFDKMAWETTSLKHTHPYEAILRPGDVLYIPPLWCHAALPLDGISVAINIFFKTEDDQRYSEGNDTYGNRDVAEYEHARNDISKAIGRFALMPKDARRFYLERLANEVTQQARKKG